MLGGPFDEVAPMGIPEPVPLPDLLAPAAVQHGAEARERLEGEMGAVAAFSFSEKHDEAARRKTTREGCTRDEPLDLPAAAARAIAVFTDLFHCAVAARDATAFAVDTFIHDGCLWVNFEDNATFDSALMRAQVAAGFLDDAVGALLLGVQGSSPLFVSGLIVTAVTAVSAEVGSTSPTRALVCVCRLALPTQQAGRVVANSLSVWWSEADRPDVTAVFGAATFHSAFHGASPGFEVTPVPWEQTFSTDSQLRSWPSPLDEQLTVYEWTSPLATTQLVTRHNVVVVLDRFNLPCFHIELTAHPRSMFVTVVCGASDNADGSASADTAANTLVRPLKTWPQCRRRAGESLIVAIVAGGGTLDGGLPAAATAAAANFMVEDHFHTRPSCKGREWYTKLITLLKKVRNDEGTTVGEMELAQTDIEMLTRLGVVDRHGATQPGEAVRVMALMQDSRYVRLFALDTPPVVSEKGGATVPEPSSEELAAAAAVTKLLRTFQVALADACAAVRALFPTAAPAQDQVVGVYRPQQQPHAQQQPQPHVLPHMMSPHMFRTSATSAATSLFFGPAPCAHAAASHVELQEEAQRVLSDPAKALPATTALVHIVPFTSMPPPMVEEVPVPRAGREPHVSVLVALNIGHPELCGLWRNASTLKTEAGVAAVAKAATLAALMQHPLPGTPAEKAYLQFVVFSAAARVLRSALDVFPASATSSRRAGSSSNKRAPPSLAPNAARMSMTALGNVAVDAASTYGTSGADDDDAQSTRSRYTMVDPDALSVVSGAGTDDDAFTVRSGMTSMSRFSTASGVSRTKSVYNAETGTATSHTQLARPPPNAGPDNMMAHMNVELPRLRASDDAEAEAEREGRPAPRRYVPRTAELDGLALIGDLLTPLAKLECMLRIQPFVDEKTGVQTGVVPIITTRTRADMEYAPHVVDFGLWHDLTEAQQKMCYEFLISARAAQNQNRNFVDVFHGGELRLLTVAILFGVNIRAWLQAKSDEITILGAKWSDGAKGRRLVRSGGGWDGVHGMGRRTLRVILWMLLQFRKRVAELLLEGKQTYCALWASELMNIIEDIAAAYVASKMRTDLRHYRRKLEDEDEQTRSGKLARRRGVRADPDDEDPLGITRAIYLLAVVLTDDEALDPNDMPSWMRPDSDWEALDLPRTHNPEDAASGRRVKANWRLVRNRKTGVVKLFHRGVYKTVALRVEGTVATAVCDYVIVPEEDSDVELETSGSGDEGGVGGSSSSGAGGFDVEAINPTLERIARRRGVKVLDAKGVVEIPHNKTRAAGRVYQSYTNDMTPRLMATGGASAPPRLVQVRVPPKPSVPGRGRGRPRKDQSAQPAQPAPRALPRPGETWDARPAPASAAAPVPAPGRGKQLSKRKPGRPADKRKRGADNDTESEEDDAPGRGKQLSKRKPGRPAKRKRGADYDSTESEEDDADDESDYGARRQYSTRGAERRRAFAESTSGAVTHTDPTDHMGALMSALDVADSGSFPAFPLSFSAMAGLGGFGDDEQDGRDDVMGGGGGEDVNDDTAQHGFGFHSVAPLPPLPSASSSSFSAGFPSGFPGGFPSFPFLGGAPALAGPMPGSPARPPHMPAPGVFSTPSQHPVRSSSITPFMMPFSPAPLSGPASTHLSRFQRLTAPSVPTSASRDSHADDYAAAMSAMSAEL